ncbi:HAD family hydrolase [Lactobacillus alvi]|uniref:HAD family hydrolase n=1 Tax=Limosilactobacillus alvi TaxID=990412 RepID=A0ABS2ELQ8_9LACO|nr:HAD family hydrolase [Limosilactobacillus alvi]MBM6753301.1 HAD family hydrolase [Limosilactobacillus alvi]
MPYLISDLDHTLLNEKGEISEFTRKVIRQSDWQVMLASARMPSQMVDLITELKLTGPQLALNGAVIFQYQNERLERLQHQPVPDKLAQQLFELVHQQLKLPIQWVANNKFWSTEWTPQVQMEIDYTGVKVQYASQLPTITIDDFLIQIPDPIKFNQVQNLIHEQLPNLTLADSGDGYLVITAPGVNKAQAVHYLLNQNIPSQQIVAVGDDLNDLPMLKAAGIPMAVANAKPALKAVAKKILLDNESDGIAHFLRQS